MGHRKGEAYEPRRTEGYPYIAHFGGSTTFITPLAHHIWVGRRIAHAEVRHRRLRYFILFFFIFLKMFY